MDNAQSIGPSATILHGDSLFALKGIPDGYFDACVCDPPYGLSFMGKKWDYDVPSVELWAEVLRVLKPGGHCLSFGGTRTYHRMVVNMEDAGFEIRDQVMWIYGSGFPKSMDVSKAIDKAAGAEREVVSMKKRTGAMFAGNNNNDGPTKDVWREKQAGITVEITAPSTPDAKTWQGWGTALKPANEPICLARKPLSEKTVAKNVLKHGTGAINIDESRIGTDMVPSKKCNGGDKYAAFKGGEQTENLPWTYTQGRWPANILFDESAAQMLDEQSGVIKTKEPITKLTKNFIFGDNSGQKFAPQKGATLSGASRFFKTFKQDEQWQDQKSLSNAEHATQPLDQDEALLNSVHEAVKTSFKKDHHLLQCLDSIPDYKRCILYQDLASLVAESRSIGTTEIIQSLLKLFGSVPHATEENINSVNLENSSGPTRFLYQAKASKRERNAGLEGMPLVAATSKQQNSSGRMENGVVTNERPEEPKQQNFHPTVKPIKLMEYLIKLITPPGGIVLDPFMGSGSTGVAAMRTGFNFVGCELMEEYVEIATKRIKAAKDNNQSPEVEEEQDVEQNDL